VAEQRPVRVKRRQAAVLAADVAGCRVKQSLSGIPRSFRPEDNVPETSSPASTR
jgi:hypothetical protein